MFRVKFICADARTEFPWLCTSVTIETIREGRASRTEIMGKEQVMRLGTRPNFVTAELCRTLPRDKDAMVEGRHFGFDF